MWPCFEGDDPKYFNAYTYEGCRAWGLLKPRSRTDLKSLDIYANFVTIGRYKFLGPYGIPVVHTKIMFYGLRVYGCQHITFLSNHFLVYIWYDIVHYMLYSFTPE